MFELDSNFMMWKADAIYFSVYYQNIWKNCSNYIGVFCMYKGLYKAFIK